MGQSPRHQDSTTLHIPTQPFLTQITSEKSLDPTCYAGKYSFLVLFQLCTFLPEYLLDKGKWRDLNDSEAVKMLTERVGCFR